MAKPASFDPHYGVTRAANYVGVHRTTIRRYVRSGKLKPDGRTPNGDDRFKQSTLEQLLHVGRG